MLTEKDYCEYDTSITLGELGFPLKRMKVRNFIDGKFSDSIVTVLLYDAQKFLRERYHLHITIYSQSQESWQYRITKPHQRLEEGLHGEDFSSFEEALSEGVREAIKFLKEE